MFSPNHNCPKSNHTNLVMSECELTRGTVVHEGTEGLAIPPVLVKVVNRQLRYLVLNPAQQPLFGSEFLNLFIILILPHGHGDGVMENKCPDETQNQLQVPIYNGFAVCTGPRQSKGNRVSSWYYHGTPLYSMTTISKQHCTSNNIKVQKIVICINSSSVSVYFSVSTLIFRRRLFKESGLP